MSSRRAALIIMVLTLLASACGSDAVGPVAVGATSQPGAAVEIPTPVIYDIPDPDTVYDPVIAGEQPPPVFRQLLRRDDIAPVYIPEFTNLTGVDWADDALVIGVDLEGEARAYPVGFLTRREMVIDNHRGIPTLVTW